MLDMALQRRTGAINLTNPGIISHEEILQMYKTLVDPTKTWQTMSYDEQSVLLKSKRSNNELNTSKLVQWYPQVSNIHTAVYKALQARAAFFTHSA